VLPRTKYVPKHRSAPAASALRTSLHQAAGLTGVTLGAAGLVLAGGAALQPEAPADAANAITVGSTEHETSVTGGTFADREDEASRSVRRTTLESPKKRSAKEPPRRPIRNADPARTDPRAAAREMLPEFGFAASEFGCLDALYVSESDWDMYADNPTSTAYGIPQALLSEWDVPPGYRTNATTQIRWGLGYIRDSYGTPCSAWEFKQANDYY